MDIVIWNKQKNKPKLILKYQSDNPILPPKMPNVKKSFEFKDQCRTKKIAKVEISISQNEHNEFVYEMKVIENKMSGHFHSDKSSKGNFIVLKDDGTSSWKNDDYQYDYFQMESNGNTEKMIEANCQGKSDELLQADGLKNNSNGFIKANHVCFENDQRNASRNLGPKRFCSSITQKEKLPKNRDILAKRADYCKSKGYLLFKQVFHIF